MKSFNEDSRVREVRAREQAEREAITRLEDELLQMDQAAVRLQKIAQRVAAEHHIGDRTQEEVETAQTALDEAARAIEAKSRDLEMRRTALGLLEDKAKRTEWTVKQEILAEAHTAHAEGLQRLVSALQEVQGAIDSLVPVELSFRQNGGDPPPMGVGYAREVGLVAHGSVTFTARDFIERARRAGHASVAEAQAAA